MRTIKYFLLLSLMVLFSACTENDEEVLTQSSALEEFDSTQSFENQIMSISNNNFENIEIVSAYSEVMTEILKMSKEQDFRTIVYESTIEANSFNEDYVMNLASTAKKLKTSKKFGKSSTKIESLISKIQELSPDDSPMIFFPKAETLEDKKTTNKNFNTAKNLNQPVAVLKGAYNDDYSAPDYKLNSDGELIFDRMVSEEDAWNNDVYVIGKSENVVGFSKICDGAIQKSGDCYSGGGGGSSSNDTRTDGRSEYGGLIQLTDMNAIEHWFSGQFEFQVVVVGVEGSAATIIKSRKFPKVKRKHFKDKKWYDYGDFFFNWNKSTLGEFNVEKWIERDGGKTAEISVSLSFKPKDSPVSTTATIKVPSKDKDDDLGQSIVQFPDKLSRAYSISFMNFKRK